jgi:ABC-type branched-subunit amino acid transport system substrate-binding protein
MIRQAYDVGLFPASSMLVSYDVPVRPEFWKTVGEKGAQLGFIVYYHPTMKLPPRGDQFRKKYMEQFKEEPVYGAFNGYTQVMLIADAIAAAKSDRGEDLLKPLLSMKFEGWNGTIGFSRGEGPYWQQWTPPMLITQYTRAEQPFGEVKISFPPEFRTGDWMSPKK